MRAGGHTFLWKLSLHAETSCFFRHHIDCLRAWPLLFIEIEERNSGCRVTKKSAMAFWLMGLKLWPGVLKYILPARTERDRLFCYFMLANAWRIHFAAIHFSVVPVRWVSQTVENDVSQQIDFAENNERLKPLHLRLETLLPWWWQWETRGAWNTPDCDLTV